MRSLVALAGVLVLSACSAQGETPAETPAAPPPAVVSQQVSDEERFVRVAREIGPSLLDNVSDAQLVEMGEGFCRGVDEVGAEALIVSYYEKSDGDAVVLDTLSAISASAAAALCPEHGPALDRALSG